MRPLLLPGVGATPDRLSGDMVFWLQSAEFLRLAFWSSASRCAGLIGDRPLVRCYAYTGIS